MVRRVCPAASGRLGAGHKSISHKPFPRATATLYPGNSGELHVHRFRHTSPHGSVVVGAAQGPVPAAGRSQTFGPWHKPVRSINAKPLLAVESKKEYS